jgi:hypothetical protein
VLAINAIALFKGFVGALFDTAFLASLGLSAGKPISYPYDVRSGIREAIIEAGKVRQLIRMRYDNRERDIEPYSFRFKATQKGYAAEYFYGFDRTRGHTIKSYFLYKIQGVSILPLEYTPRWVVEF